MKEAAPKEQTPDKYVMIAQFHGKIFTEVSDDPEALQEYGEELKEQQLKHFPNADFSESVQIWGVYDLYL